MFSRFGFGCFQVASFIIVSAFSFLFTPIQAGTQRIQTVTLISLNTSSLQYISLRIYQLDMVPRRLIIPIIAQLSVQVLRVLQLGYMKSSTPYISARSIPFNLPVQISAIYMSLINRPLRISVLQQYDTIVALVLPSQLLSSVYTFLVQGL